MNLFPETSLMKWMSEGALQEVADEKHLVVRLPDTMLNDAPDVLMDAYTEWKA